MGKKICLDLRALQVGHENRGIGMVAKSILENLDDNENTYLFYTFSGYDPIKKLGIKLKINDYQIVSTPTLKTSIKSPKDIIDLYRLSHHSFKNLKILKPDIFIQFDFALGAPTWRNTKTFCFAYDLIPLIMKNEYLPNPIDVFNQTIGKKAKIKAFTRALYYRYKFNRDYKVYKKVDKIISISDATKVSFVNLLGIRSNKIYTIPLAPVASTVKASDSIVKKINKPYILYIGGTDSRKRIEEVVFAFNIARGRGEDISLVLAGNEFRDIATLPNIVAKNAIIASPYKSDIHLVGFVADAEKLGLYQNAHAFIFCTTYEGFGLPIIEAQAAGCPVISYDNSSIREVAGKATELVKTGDYVDVAHRIISLNNSAAARDASIRIGKHQAKKYTWGNYIRSFEKILN